MWQLKVKPIIELAGTFKKPRATTYKTRAQFSVPGPSPQLVRMAPAAIAMDDTSIAAFAAQRQVTYCYGRFWQCFPVDLAYALAPVAALTFIVYDVILSLNQEVIFTSHTSYPCLNLFIPQVQHVWRSRWSSVKVLYFFVRYPVIFYLAYVFLCHLTIRLPLILK